MPELPEVETVVRTLKPAVTGRRIKRVRLGDVSLRREWPPELLRLGGQRIDDVRRRGKWIIVELEPSRLLIHLGMTGQVTSGPPDRRIPPHTHLFMDLDDGSQLRLRDTRRFGSVDYFASAIALREFLDARLGPEPFDLTPVYWRMQLVGKLRAIKAVLLDQKVVAGVGNIYADESLFAARIHPAARANTIGKGRAENLRRALIDVLHSAVEHRGSSIRDYLDADGKPGGYQHRFAVYGRKGEPCLRCKTPIERIRLAGRSTHFCPKCQRN